MLPATSPTQRTTYCPNESYLRETVTRKNRVTVSEVDLRRVIPAYAPKIQPVNTNLRQAPASTGIDFSDIIADLRVVDPGVCASRQEGITGETVTVAAAFVTFKKSPGSDTNTARDLAIQLANLVRNSTFSRGNDVITADTIRLQSLPSSNRNTPRFDSLTPSSPEEAELAAVYGLPDRTYELPTSVLATMVRW